MEQAEFITLFKLRCKVTALVYNKKTLPEIVCLKIVYKVESARPAAPGSSATCPRLPVYRLAGALAKSDAARFGAQKFHHYFFNL
ncbi:MAG: hypothetical protein SPL48_07085 [Bacteroidales bacterium]|nr:hypothetical protein [Bacteroidales bacterium]MDY6260256.1 hypothetical protein [Bacteroidales bacterium]